MKIQCITCPECHDVVMADFLSSHLQFVHGFDSLRAELAYQDTLASDLLPIGIPSTATPNPSVAFTPKKNKARKNNRTEVRHITVIEHTPRPIDSAHGAYFQRKILPSSEELPRCPKCARAMREKELKVHLEHNYCDLYLRKNHESPEPSQSIQTVSGGLPSLGKRSR